MNIRITGKNFNTYRHLEETIDKKFEKLSKYFSDDIDVNIVLSQERNKDKIEVNINAKGARFRTEQVSEDIYEGIDKAVDKLAAQMSKLKGKLQKRYHDNKSVKFEAIPDYDMAGQEENLLVKTKTLELMPMNEKEAILEMEMIDHDFYVFINDKTNQVNVVYKRNDGNYGLLETKN
ncbi:MAG: ribosome-associated translation inhibitor RaiA [Eubacterium sp.]|nr:ribosome-associated translation inhibitor RaiA [Eubacterium sp.]